MVKRTFAEHGRKTTMKMTSALDLSLDELVKQRSRKPYSDHGTGHRKRGRGGRGNGHGGRLAGVSRHDRIQRQSSPYTRPVHIDLSVLFIHHN